MDKQYIIVENGDATNDDAVNYVNNLGDMLGEEELQRELTACMEHCEREGEEFKDEFTVFEVSFTKINTTPTKRTRTVTKEVTGYSFDIDEGSTEATLQETPTAPKDDGLSFKMD